MTLPVMTSMRLRGVRDRDRGTAALRTGGMAMTGTVMPLFPDQNLLCEMPFIPDNPCSE